MDDLDIAFMCMCSFVGIIFFEDVDEGVLPFLDVIHMGLMVQNLN